MHIMKKQLAATIIICSLPLLFISCVSSILKDAPPVFSKEIKLRAPGSPFVQTDTSVYPSWKNPKSGNVIAIVSDCDPNSSYSLTSLPSLVENPLTNIKVAKEQTITLQSKPALRRVVTATLDDHDIEVESVSFKRKSCSYVSSLSGKTGTLDADRAQFENFNSGFSFE